MEEAFVSETVRRVQMSGAVFRVAGRRLSKRIPGGFTLRQSYSDDAILSARQLEVEKGRKRDEIHSCLFASKLKPRAG